MAHYRKIDVRIWNDERFLDLSAHGKLVFLFILTHPNMTSLGAMRATIPGLAVELGIPPEAFREAFREVFGKGIVSHDEKACFVGITNWFKYNTPESPNVVKAWKGSLDFIPECKAKNVVIQRAKEKIEGLSEAFQEAFGEVFGKPSARSSRIRSSSSSSNSNRNNQPPPTPPGPQTGPGGDGGEGISSGLPPKPKTTPTPNNLTHVQRVVRGFKASMRVPLEDSAWDKVYFPRYARHAKDLLALFGNDLPKTADCIDAVVAEFERRKLPWTPDTIVRHASDFREGRLLK